MNKLKKYMRNHGEKINKYSAMIEFYEGVLKFENTPKIVARVGDN